MGNSIAPENNNIQNKRYTNSEIKQNIQQLFLKNKNNLVDTSYTFNEEFDVSNVDNQYVGGTSHKSIKFRSSKNRHLRHNIENYVEKLQKQYGGNENNGEADLKELSEFNKIKQYLLDDLKNDHTGGSNLSSELSNMSFSTSTPSNNNMSLFNMLIGGQQNDETSSPASFDESENDKQTSDQSNDQPTSEISESDKTDTDKTDTDKTDTETDPMSSTSTDEVPPAENGFSSTSYSTIQKKNKKRSSYTSSNVSDVSTPYVIQNTDSSLDSSISLNNNNELTNSESSELNIIPFYSTESSHKHPYVAKRFRR